MGKDQQSMKLSDLKCHDRNPRTIKGDAFTRLCESIKRDPEFMVLRPIVHDNGVILGGNQRYRACKHLGMKEVPDMWVRDASHLTDEQKKRFILVDNAPEGMAGEWDFDILSADWEVPELIDLGFDLPMDSEPPGGTDGVDVPDDKVKVSISIPGAVWLSKRSAFLATLEKIKETYLATATVDE
jgi:hypothetical protein